jgi:O-antigen ligase
MTLGGILAMVLLATLPRLLPGAWRPRWFPLPWLVMLAGLAATYVRGAWLGFAGGAVTLGVLVRRGRLWLAAGLAVLVLAFAVGPAGVRARFLSMADASDATIAERLRMFRSGVLIWRDHPWLGTGKGELRHVYARYAQPGSLRQRTSHVHNTPLQIAAERGVFALAAWIWIWVAFYRDAVGVLRRLPPDRPRARALTAGSLCAITGFLVTGLSEYSFGDSEVVMVAWALMALPYVVARSLPEGARRAGAAISRPRTARSTCGA